MNIMLGNLTAEQMESRSGVVFSDALKEILKKTHQENAGSIKEGMWHCYDIPFVLVCGGLPLAQKIYDELKSQSSNFKEILEISLA